MPYVIRGDRAGEPKSKCPRCGAPLDLLEPAHPESAPVFYICQADTLRCGYIEQLNVGPVERE